MSVNFFSSGVKPLFIRQLVFWLFFVSLFLILRRFPLYNILKPVTAGVSLILFVYGILQKLVLFPAYLSQIENTGGFFNQALLARIESGRIFSIFTLPTQYAVICAALIIFLFHYWLHSPIKWFWSLLLLLGMVNLVLTQSFGGLLYLAAGIFFYLFYEKIVHLRFLAPVAMALSLFFFVIIGFRFSEVKELEPLKLRISHWKQATRIVAAHPWRGVGLGNYAARVSRHKKPGEASSIFAHNFFLQLMAETGLPFVVFVLGLLLLSGRQMAPRGQPYFGLFMAVLITLVVYNLVDIGVYFFSLALVAAVTLSQIFPRLEPVSTAGKRLPAVFLLASAVFLLAWTVADHRQKQGDILASQYETQAAMREYRSSLQMNPWNFRALVGSAALHIQFGQPQTADRILRRALRINRFSAYGNYLMSRLAARRGQAVNALAYAAAAMRNHPHEKLYRNWRDSLREQLTSPPPADTE